MNYICLMNFQTLEYNNMPPRGLDSNGFGRLIKRLSLLIQSRLFLFNGFFDWFSTPVCPAHLAQKKEQSKESSKIHFCKCGASFSSRIQYGKHLTWCPNISIQQSILELALSALTTNDLEARKGNRIVASIVAHQATLMVQSGEESVKQQSAVSMTDLVLN